MATYLLFTDEAAAIAGEARARENVLRALASIAPERLPGDGTIYSVSAATWQVIPAAQRTERWAIPEAARGGWIMPVPTEQEIAPIPLAVFLAGVGGELIEITDPADL